MRISFYIIVCIVAILCFASSIPGDFVYDDNMTITKNRDVSNLTTPLIHLFLDDFWGTPVSRYSSHKSYRPLTILTFRLNYILAGETPHLYHIINILCHVFCCILLCKLCQKLFRIELVTFTAGLLFASHPIHCDAVSNITGRSELLSFIFCFLSIITFIKSINLKQRGKTNWNYFFLSLLCSWASLLCKETGYIAVILFGVYDLSQFLHRFLVRKQMRAYLQRFLLRQIVNLILFLGTLYLRYCWTGTVGVNHLDGVSVVSKEPTRLARILTSCHRHMYHYWLLLFPFYLAGDYSHSSLPVVRSFNDPNFLLIAAFYILLFGLLPYFVLKKYSSKYWPSLFFIYGLLTLPFLPLSNLLYYVMFEVAERVMYIPSAAFCILVSALLFLPVDNRNLSQKMNLRNFPPETLEKKKIAKSDEGGFIKKFWLLDHNRTVFIPFLIVVILFAIRCHLRNYDWRTNDSFWMTLFDRFPNNYKVLQLHIHQLVLKNDSSLNPRIETLYEKLLGLHFSDGDAYNFALHLFKNGKYEYGKEVLLRSLSQGSKDWSGERCVLPEIYRALHTYYMDLKDFSQAEKYLLLEAKSNFCHFKLPDFLVQQWKVSSLVKELCKPLSKGANASQFGVSFEEMVALLQGNLPSPKRWKSLSKGQSLYINNKHQASLEWYISQLNKFPAHLQLLSEMALILYFSQKYLDCAYIFNEVIKKDYFKPLNYQAMAMCLVKAGSFYEYDAQEILKMGTAALNYTQHMESLMEKKKKYLKTDQQ